MTEPHVLVVMKAHWRRALLVAALGDAGYDATGASGLSEALAYPAREPGRLPVELIVVDQHRSRDNQLLRDLLHRHSSAGLLYLDSALHRGEPEVSGVRLRYPISVADIVRQVQLLLPVSRPAQDADAHRNLNTEAQRTQSDR